MISSRRKKIIIAVLFIAALSVVLYIRRPKFVWDPGWDKGLVSNTERNFYNQKMNRIMEDWRQTKRNGERDKEGWLTETYQTYLVIDLDKKAMWLEENGRIPAVDYIEFPPETTWTLNHYTPQGNTELKGRTTLKIRGINTSQITPEKFLLTGSGTKTNLYFDFNSNSGGGGYGSGYLTRSQVSLPSSSLSADKLYGSILVTEEEYKKYAASVSDSNTLTTEDENKKAWSRIEKYLYMEIERQIQKAGFKYNDIEVKPGPDYSAAHAEIRGQNYNVVSRIFGGSPSLELYLKIDYLGNDIWYAKYAVNPVFPEMKVPNTINLELEFLVSPKGEIQDSQKKDLLKKGRELQQASAIPESKWKATLSNGITVEFLGVCENPSAGKKWWGPDGSMLDIVPYINNELFQRPREDRKIYEFAWLQKNMVSNTTVTSSFEGANGSFYSAFYDRYGNHLIGDNSEVYGFSFDKSQQVTTFKIGFAYKDWTTPLVVKDKAGEITFLDKQRIILNPPVVENGQIIVRCYEGYGSDSREYKKEFGLIIYEDSKTVPLNRYIDNIYKNQKTGLVEHKYIIDNLSLSQIEGVCFRYQPYSFIIFKNISLVPGKNQGFEIEVQEADEEKN